MKRTAGDVISAALLQGNVFGYERYDIDRTSHFIQNVVRVKGHGIQPPLSSDCQTVNLQFSQASCCRSGIGLDTTCMHPRLPEQIAIEVQLSKIAQEPIDIQTAFFDRSGILLFAVYEAGDIAGAKTVVDVDHHHIGGAAVEHREQRGEPAERTAVADAGRNRDHGNAQQSADHACQRAFHAGHDHDDAGLRQRFPDIQQSMNSRDPHIVGGFHLISHEPRRQRRFFGNRDIGSPGADDIDFPIAINLRILNNRDGPGCGMELGFLRQPGEPG